jgi:hypothetical protein
MTAADTLERPLALAAPAASADVATQVLFNSPHYYVAEISCEPTNLLGFEVVDKFSGRGAFIDGAIAVSMRENFQALVAEHDGTVSPEEVDEFIGNYDALLLQRVVYH